MRVPLFTLQDGNRLHSRIRNSTKQSSRSTPASPSRSRSMVASSNNNNNNSSGGQEQCTCMTSEQYARLRHSDTSGRLRGKRASEGTILYVYC